MDRIIQLSLSDTELAQIVVGLRVLADTCYTRGVFHGDGVAMRRYVQLNDIAARLVQVARIPIQQETANEN